jgi:hypothetical protein
MVLSPWTCVCGQRNAGPSPCSRCLTPAPDEVLLAPVVEAARRRPRWVAPLAGVTAVLLIAGVAGAAVVRDEPGRVDASELPGAQTISVTPDGGPTGLTGVAGEIAAAMPQLMRFVETARGLTFSEPVEVTLLPDDSFRARVAALSDDDEEASAEIEDSGRVLHALGLLEEGVDLEAAGDKLLGDAVAGFYDTEADDLVVRGEALTPYVKLTFVHELTHALQDQHFDLDRDDIDDRDDEASQGFTAIIEGDAVRIEEQFLDTLSDDEQKAAEQEEIEAASAIDPSIPRILFELVGFPYIVGPPFTKAVVSASGQARLDELFRDPPTTSEQLLHPELFLADGEEPRDVDDPEPDGDEIDAGVLGELGLLLIFQRTLEGSQARAAAVGWGGDRYVAWRDGDETCVRTNLVTDSAADAAELRRALRDVAAERDGFDVRATRSVITFTACD